MERLIELIVGVAIAAVVGPIIWLLGCWLLFRKG